MSTPDKQLRPAKGNPFFVRRRGLYLPAETAEAVDAKELRARLTAERNVTAVAREHQWVKLAQDTQHEIRVADLADLATRAKRSRKQRAKDAAAAAKLTDLYREVATAGADAKARAALYASAEKRAERIFRLRQVTLWGGIPVLLAFAAWSTTGVQAGVVKLLSLTKSDPAWWSAWAVEPALIAIVTYVIIARSILRSSGGNTNWKATVGEWVALTISLALNIIGGWEPGPNALGGAIAHSLGPLGAAGTAFLIGLFDGYVAQADPEKGARSLAEMNIPAPSDARHDAPAEDASEALTQSTAGQLTQGGDALGDALNAVIQGDVVASDDALPTQRGRASDAAFDASRVRRATRQATQPSAGRDASTKGASASRDAAASSTVTSNDAPDADPATQAAILYLTQSDMSYRKAADAIGGTSEGSVRRRVKQIEEANEAAAAEAALTQSVQTPMTQIPEPTQPTEAALNGHPHPSKETR